MTAELGSPTQAPALDKWSKLRLGKKYTRPATWPGSEIKLRLQVLGYDGVQESMAAAYVRWKKLQLPMPGHDISFYDFFFEEVTLQMLWRCCRDHDDISKPACESADKLRADTTVHQRDAMYDEYRDLENEVEPSAAEMDEGLFDEILDLVKKKEVNRLKSYGSNTLSSFLLSLVHRPPTSPIFSSKNSN